MLPVLHQLKVACSVVGNHEFYFGPQALEKYIQESGFPWVLSNVVAKDSDEQLVGSVRQVIIEWNGVKLGIFGLAEKEWLDTVQHVDTFARYIDFVTTANRISADLRDAGADIVICLAHMRMNNCEKLAAEAPGVDLILAGHDHFYEAKFISGKYIVLSGSDFRNLSLIKATKKTNSWEFDVQRVDITSSLAEDPEMIEVVNEFSAAVDKQLEKIIGTTGVVLDARTATNRTSETNMGNLVTDVMKEAMESDLAFINAGSIRSDDTYGPGKFSVKYLINILPFPDVIIKIRLTGQQLWDALEVSVGRYPAQDGRFLQVSGFKFGFDPDKPPGQRVLWAQVNDQPLDREKSYTAATKSYLAQGNDGYECLLGAEILIDEENGVLVTCLVRRYFMQMQIVNMLGRKKALVCQALAKWERKKSVDLYTVKPTIQGRIVNVKSNNPQLRN